MPPVTYFASIGIWFDPTEDLDGSPKLSSWNRLARERIGLPQQENFAGGVSRRPTTSAEIATRWTTHSADFVVRRCFGSSTCKPLQRTLFPMSRAISTLSMFVDRTCLQLQLSGEVARQRDTFMDLLRLLGSTSPMLLKLRLGCGKPPTAPILQTRPKLLQKI